jgi:CHAD domain-containing protein
VKSGIYLALVTNSSNRNIPVVGKTLLARREPEVHAAYLFRKLSRMLRANRTAPDAKSVHQLRTTIRRIQTLAASLGEQDSKAFGKFDKLLAEIFDRAGKVRDLDVQIEALETISLPSIEDDKVVLRNYLQRQRSKQQRKLSLIVEKQMPRRLPKRQRKAKALLLRAVKQPAGTTKASIDLRREVLPFIERLHTVTFDIDTLHEIRLDAKHVRYAAEAVGESGAEVVAMLKPVQDAIGEWHDWDNLVQTADKVLGPLPGHPLMTILRMKMKSRFANAITALKPLEARLSEAMNLGKRPGPMLVRQELLATASAV